ncbi:D-hexose-6-phosphate mutarotase [uncultured Amphritea sp.]|uniref:D-hexose-6-phosphate mutarotase n=1 Tax=uncultured Amphritea sp. TaxID=981605 RepID=UPI00263115D0|nr:D-hexose-6-phosphate mutarotase [uncultured Amphritea sp.]
MSDSTLKADLEQQISRFADGQHALQWCGYDLLLCKQSWGELVISLLGGQVLLFRPAGEKPLLWLTAKPVGAPGAIRGGVPVCWPWFAEHPEKPELTKHGVARTARWQIDSQAVDAAGGRWLMSPEQSLLDGIQLQLEITVADAELSLALTTTNGSDQPLAVTQALHSYFAVSDSRETEILGLAGCRCLDKVQGMQPGVMPSSLRFTAETDLVVEQADNSEAVVLIDHGWKRGLRITKRGGGSTVVWNPGAAAANIGDIGMDQVSRFVCVEAARTRFFDDQTLAVGATQTLATSVSVLPYPQRDQLE